MFRGKQEMNGEGQTGGAPLQSTSALPPRSKTDKGADMSKKVLGFTSRKWLCFFTGLLTGLVAGAVAAA